MISTQPADECSVTCASSVVKSYCCQSNSVMKLKQQIRSLRHQKLLLRRTTASCKRNLHVFLHPDRLEQLEDSRTGKLASATIQSAFKIRTTTGKSGYEYQKKTVGYRLPLYRILCECVESLEMLPGIQYDILELLEVKTKSMLPHEKDCVLILDEVQ